MDSNEIYKIKDLQKLNNPDYTRLSVICKFPDGTETPLTTTYEVVPDDYFVSMLTRALAEENDIDIDGETDKNATVGDILQHMENERATYEDDDFDDYMIFIETNGDGYTIVDYRVKPDKIIFIVDEG